MATLDQDGLTDANFLQYLQILATPYDITITDIDMENRIIEMNGSARGQEEFARVLAEKLDRYAV